MPKRTNLKKIAEELKAIAIEHPFDPIKTLMENGVVTGVPVRHRRDLSIGSCKFRIQFTKTRLLGRHIFQLSIGCESGNPRDVPEHIIDQIRAAFFGKAGGEEMPSALGNSRQFIGEALE